MPRPTRPDGTATFRPTFGWLVPVLISATAITGCDHPERAVHPTAPGIAPRLSLAAGIATRLTTDPAEQFAPAISGDRVVYTDTRNVDPNATACPNLDIYLFDL